jgi:hypothetical protein
MAAVVQKSDLPVDAFSEMLGKLEGINIAFALTLKKLSPKPKKSKNAIGIKRLGFVETAHVIALKNTGYIPSYLTIDDLNQDMTNVKVLSQLQNEAKKLTDYIRSSEILLSNSAYQNALSIHRYLREAAKSGQAGAKPLYLRLKKQFPHVKRPETELPPNKDGKTKV